MCFQEESSGSRSCLNHNNSPRPTQGIQKSAAKRPTVLTTSDWRSRVWRGSRVDKKEIFVESCANTYHENYTHIYIYIYKLNGIVDNNLIHNVMHTYNYAYENCMHITSPKQKQGSQLTTKRHQWLVETFHRIRRLIAWMIGWLKAVKTPLWMKENESKYTWDLEILKVVSCFFPSETCSIPLGNYEKHPTSKSGLVQLPCRHLGVVMLLLSQGARLPIFQGALSDSMIPSTFSNDLKSSQHPISASQNFPNK